ncbi:MAG TPA: hypothetical protein VG435_19785 [Acidimicrobiales bacterium]|nr:hypothetical protein [Acidimicrobiales bacterium]
MRYRRLAPAAVAGVVTFWAIAGPTTAAQASVGLAAGAACPARTLNVTCSPGPTVGSLPCQPERFPQAGAARSADSQSYEIPFTATLGPDPEPATASSGLPSADPQGGWLEIVGKSRLVAGATVTVTLGGPVVNQKGTVYAQGCGLTNLPSEVGGIGADTYQPTGSGGKVNPNFIFAPKTPVSLGLSPAGIPLPIASPIVAYGSSDGFLNASIQRTPAANGGLNVDFYASAKSTTDLADVLADLGSSLSGQDCTVAIGSLADAGLPAADFPKTGLTTKQATTQVHLSTLGSVPDPTVPTLADKGQPVTGPIAPKGGVAQDSATLVAGSAQVPGLPVGGTVFPVGAIQPDMTPSPGFPSYGGCSASNATLLNELIGLPNMTDNYFYAPGTFAVFTSS